MRNSHVCPCSFYLRTVRWCVEFSLMKPGEALSASGALTANTLNNDSSGILARHILTKQQALLRDSGARRHAVTNNPGVQP